LPRVSHGFAKSRLFTKFGCLEHPKPTPQVRGSGGGLEGVVWEASQSTPFRPPSPTPGLGCLEGVWKLARKTANSGQFSATIYGLFPKRHPKTGAMVWESDPNQTHLAQVRVAKLASLLKSPQPVMACHDRLGWVEQTCQASQAGC